MNLKEIMEGYMERFGEMKGKGGNDVIVLSSPKVKGIKFFKLAIAILPSVMISLLSSPEYLHYPLKLPKLKFLGVDRLLPPERLGAQEQA